MIIIRSFDNDNTFLFKISYSLWYSSYISVAYLIIAVIIVALLIVYGTYYVMLHYFHYEKRIDIEKAVNYTNKNTINTNKKNQLNDIFTIKEDIYGIVGMEIYFPSLYITQEDLEIINNVPSGKYTKGLGQYGLSFVSDREDVNSIALTVTHNLLDKYNINPKDIGRIEIGTETLIDKSKSTKTHLMDLFPDNIVDIQGVTNLNACYGGTAAFLNSINWLHNNNENKYAIVIAVDIAYYSDGPARPTSGCGAAALLLGKNMYNNNNRNCLNEKYNYTIPLILEKNFITTYASNVYDFYKPCDMKTEYPIVFGSISQESYLTALTSCYKRFCQKNIDFINSKNTSNQKCNFFGVNDIDYFIFHSPYNKLVQKAFTKLILLDCLQNPRHPTVQDIVIKIQDYLVDKKNMENQTMDKKLELLLRQLTCKIYDKKVTFSDKISQQIGNSYTASVFINLASLIESVSKFSDRNDKKNKRICVFSYGSGAMASMYSFVINAKSSNAQALAEINPGNRPQFSLDMIARNLDSFNRLNKREKCLAEEFLLQMKYNEKRHFSQVTCANNICDTIFNPIGKIERLFENTYYLDYIDNNYRRFYKRKAKNGTTSSQIAYNYDSYLSSLSTASCLLSIKASDPGEKDWFCVVLGTSLGLPSSYNEDTTYANIFQDNNMDRLLNGENMLSKLSWNTKKNIIDKNIKILQKKRITNGCNDNSPSSSKSIISSYKKLSSIDDCIQVAGRLPINNESNKNYVNKEESINTSILADCKANHTYDLILDKYGLCLNMIHSMDISCKLAVAAGLETLINSQIYSSIQEKTTPNVDNQWKNWVLPKELQRRFGIIYATSFPLLDSLTTELSRYYQCKSGNIQDQYEFNRKFLFKLLLLANSQLAQIIGAKGPNMQVNTACSGMTSAIGLAYDWLALKKCDYVLVVSSDCASNENNIEWIGTGFRALNAASISGNIYDAAKPFDKKRNGMVLSSGAVGMLLHRENIISIGRPPIRNAIIEPDNKNDLETKVILVASQYSNSAFHGAALDSEEVSQELKRFLYDIEKEKNITKEEIASNGIYFSHETFTNSSPKASCAYTEISALRKVFGSYYLKKLIIANTKGFTGHPMSVSFEDIAAIGTLKTGILPKIANLETIDEVLGEDIQLSKGYDKHNKHDRKYVLRFAAGFGSQLAFTLYMKVS